MNFQNLEYFLVLSEEENITRAAERLHLTQQALSGQLKRLEEEVGTALFTRKPDFKLTYAGETFREQAEKMLNLKLQSENMLKDIEGNTRGRLRIGISYSRGRAILPLVLPAYSAAHPYVDLSIVEESPDLMESLLMHGELDVLINFLPFSSAEIAGTPLFKERIFAVVSRTLLSEHFGGRADEILRGFEKSGDLSLFQELPFILLRKGEHIRMEADAEFLRLGISPEIRIETANTQTAIALSAKQMGVAIVHEIFLTTHTSITEDLAVLPVTPITPDTIGIGTGRAHYLPKLTRDFIELCREKLKDFTYKGNIT